MRILVVTTISNTFNAFLAPHLLALRSAGHDVDVACSIMQPLLPDVLKSVDNVFQVHFRRSPLHLENLRALRQIHEILSVGQYDVVHVHTPIAGAIVRMAASVHKETRIVYTAHGFHFYSGAPIVSWLFYFPLEWALSYVTDVLITINDEDFRRTSRLFKHPTVVKVPGVGVTEKEPSGLGTDLEDGRLVLPEESKLLVSVGELNANKGHALIIQALSHLPDHFHYALAGEGAHREILGALAETLRVSHRVHFLGFQRDVKPLLAKCDIFVHPSHREGLPVAVMEAMQEGKPVVATRIRGIVDLVPRTAGILLPHRDPRGWASAVAAIAEYPEMYGRGRELVSDFNVEHAVEATLGAYASVLENRGRRE